MRPQLEYFGTPSRPSYNSSNDKARVKAWLGLWRPWIPADIVNSLQVAFPTTSSEHMTDGLGTRHRDRSRKVLHPPTASTPSPAQISRRLVPGLVNSPSACLLADSKARTLSSGTSNNKEPSLLLTTHICPCRMRGGERSNSSHHK